MGIKNFTSGIGKEVMNQLAREKLLPLMQLVAR
jgi:hypothetical protein